MTTTTISNSLLQRLIGAAALDTAIYEEVEADPAATAQAFLIVIASSLAAGVGARGLIDVTIAGMLLYSAIALVAWAAWALLVFEIGARLMPGSRGQPTPMAVSFEGNALTSDRDTFAWCVRQITAHPELALGGPSMQWTKAALEEMARLYIAPLPNLPVLVLLGSDESVVSPNVVRTQVAQMPQGELVELPGALHEIFMERLEVQAEVWRRIDGFLAAVPARRGLAAAVS